MFFYAVLCSLFSIVFAQNPIAGPFEGDGTYYGAGGSIGGSCSLDRTNSLNLASALNINTVAMNAPQYDGSEACGMCVMYRGTNPSCNTCGLTPILSAWQYAIVTNECPECKFGDLDQALNGDGRFTIEWYEIQCNVGDSFFHYALQGSNPNYIKIQVSNTRYGVQAVSVNGISLARTTDNYFQGYGNFAFPSTIQITSMFGDTLTDTLTFSGYGNSECEGNVQFPDKGYETVSGVIDQLSNSSNTTSSSSPSIVLSPSPPINSQPTNTPSSTVTSTSISTSYPSPTPSQTSIPTNSPTTDIAPSPISPIQYPPQPPSFSPVTSTNSVPLYEQCGGLWGIICDVFDCTDGPWVGYYCETGSCYRSDSSYWQCRNYPFGGPSRKLKYHLKN